MSVSKNNYDLSVAYVHYHLTILIPSQFLQMVFDDLLLDSIFHLNMGSHSFKLAHTRVYKLLTSVVFQNLPDPFCLFVF